jgi:hypothetical protein
MNNTRWSLSLIAPVAIVLLATSAHADQKSDRTAIADSLNKLSASAAALAQTAKSSDDRGARKKFAPAAADLGDDLAALARRTGKDVPLKTISKDAAAIEKDANALIELADEAEDKAERKSLRATAVLIGQGIANARKSIDAAAATDDKPAAPAAPIRFTGRILNNSDSCSWAENLRFNVSRNGQVVFQSGLVFPGKDQPLVVEKGQYLIQFTDTSGKHLGQGTLDANKDGWSFKSGCVNQD